MTDYARLTNDELLACVLEPELRAELERRYVARRPLSTWRKLRLLATANLGGKCAVCGELSILTEHNMGTLPNLELDHIAPSAGAPRRHHETGAALRECAAGQTAGYQLLCKLHHQQKTKADIAALLLRRAEAAS